MPLPTPDYLSSIYVHWNGDQVDGILLDSTATENQVIRWDTLREQEYTIFDTVITAYANKLVIAAEADYLTWPGSPPGWQVIDFGGSIVGANPTGLSTTETYSFDVLIDAGVQHIAVPGASAQTFDDLVVTIAGLLTGATIAIDSDNNVTITSSTIGAGSVVYVSNDELFHYINGFVHFGTDSNFQRFAGYDTVVEMILQTYLGRLVSVVTIPHKPIVPSGPLDSLRVYFHHGDAAWKYLYNDAAA